MITIRAGKKPSVSSRGTVLATVRRTTLGSHPNPDNTSRQLSDPSCGNTSVNESGTSKIGQEAFAQSESASGFGSQGCGALFADDAANFYSTDVLTPTSTTLPTGTAVQFKVTLTVNPTTVNAPCILDVSSPSLGFDASGQDKARQGSLYVEGSCEGMTYSHPGTFVFRLDSPNSGKPGTKDVGVLTGYIGTPLTIVSDGQVATGVCGNGCIGTTSDGLAGTVRYSIKSATPGVSFTTASGYKYR